MTGKTLICAAVAVVVTMAGFVTSLRAQETGPGPLPPPPGFVLVDDMWVPDGDSSYTATAWPGGLVPYAFDGAVSQAQRNLFMKAFWEIEAVSAVDFVPWNSGLGSNYVYIQHGSQSNVSSSSLGMVGGPQALNVGANHWDLKYILVHELFHALGFIHEQQRPDRNGYVTINTQNISQTGCGGGTCNHNFQMQPSAAMPTVYDYRSIMHYGPNNFSNGGGPTITCLNSLYQNVIGNRTFMSDGDALGMAHRYGASPGPGISSLLPGSVNAGSNDTWVAVSGTRFFEGSPNGDGVQGSRVMVNFAEVQTIFVDQNTLLGLIPASMLEAPGSKAIQVKNDLNYAGGWSNPLSFNVTVPPCPTLSDRMGNGVAGLGDVNGDGHGDYAVGAPGFGNGGAVWCISGRDSQILWTRLGGTNYDFGHSVANGGDMTGDGIDDALIGVPGCTNNTGRAYVINGATGATVYYRAGTFSGEQFGWSLSTTGDITGDLVPDFVVGSPFFLGGRVRVFNGATAALIFHITESQSGAGFGYSVGGGHDVNGDGTPDFAVGAPNYDTSILGQPSYTDSGRVTMYSGGTGSSMVHRVGDAGYDYFGRSVALVPSLLGTGNAFTIVGATDVGTLSGTQSGPGYVRVFRGYSFAGAYSTWQTWQGSATGDNYGQSVAYAGDINDDGYPDVTVGASQGGVGFGSATGPGFVEIRAGRTGNLLHTATGWSTGDRYGWSVSGAGDTNGDAVAEVVVGAPSRDTPCLSAGGYGLVNPPIPPERHKLMITEVSTFEPDGLEITNFATTPISLSGWKVIWRKTGLGGGVEVALPSATLQPGEIAVIKEPGGSFPEMPPGTQVFQVLPSLSTSTEAVAVALRSPSGIIADEVRCSESSLRLGGLFRGYALDVQPGPIVGPRNCERVWGLDSNSGGDWRSNGQRTFGLENTSSGYRGYDPITPFFVRINELDTNPDYIEFYTSLALDMQGWSLLCSNQQNAYHVPLTPWPDSYPVTAGSFFVIGDFTTPPAELPGGGLYRGLNTVSGGSIPWGTSEMDCALYDRYGRLVDLVRTTGHDDNVVHNHPRAPSAWHDFTGAAYKHTNGDGIIGRNSIQSDTDTGYDWIQQSARSMGSSNGSGASYLPNGEPQLDVRLHGTPAGGGLTCIINAGSARAGQTWTFTFTYGHLEGTGPIIGLGPAAISNYYLMISTPPFFGTLDSRGSARLDVPSGSVPVGIQTDDIFLIHDQAGVLTTYTAILEWDS